LLASHAAAEFFFGKVLSKKNEKAAEQLSLPPSQI